MQISCVYVAFQLRVEIDKTMIFDKNDVISARSVSFAGGFSVARDWRRQLIPLSRILAAHLISMVINYLINALCCCCCCCINDNYWFTSLYSDFLHICIMQPFHQEWCIKHCILSVCLSVFLSVRLYVPLYVCVCLSVCMSYLYTFVTGEQQVKFKFAAQQL